MALAKSQRSLKAWGKQKWRTKSGKPSSKTGERYLPSKAIKSLSASEYAATTAAKRKGRDSYNKATGGNLKAPQPEGGPRKKSFCARMRGMKKKLTSKKSANDPQSRINKALRAWKC